MSVIFGILDFHSDNVNEVDLMSMKSILNHWNADEESVWCYKNIGLGHLMMYNTPESLNEKLPLANSESDLCITADLRIDNRENIISILGINKVRNFDIPDSNLVLLLYQKYGQNCIDYIIGDFVFAIWDIKKQILFCARDHMGVKPFFYYIDNNKFIFASEIKGILSVPKINSTINKQFLYNQMIIGPSEQNLDATLYNNIKRLEPANTIQINASNSQIVTNKYWSLDEKKVSCYKNKSDYYEGLIHHFTEAVKCRTRSIYNLGVQLSGGIDSSAITGVAANILRNEGKVLSTISNTLSKNIFDPQLIKHDERGFIDEVNLYNEIKEKIYITGNVFKNAIDEVDFCININSGLDSYNFNWLIPLHNAAFKNNIRTLLSGFPGDELVTYRGKYYFLDFLDQQQYLKYFKAKKKYPGFNKIEPITPYWMKRAIMETKMFFRFYDVDIKSTLEIFNIPTNFIRGRKLNLWNSFDYQNQFKSYRHFQKLRFQQNYISQRMEGENRMGLYFKTESRFPMADIRLAQYYLSLPNELKYEGVISRTMFRNSLQEFMPDLILERDNKQGSVAPFLINKKFEEDAINELISNIPEHPIYDKNALLKRIKLHAYLESDKFRMNYRQKTMHRLPNLEVLRWLEKNIERL